MNFQLIPIDNISSLKLKYNKEILTIKSQNNPKLLEKNMLKILSKNFSFVQNGATSYFIRVKDSFQTKKFSFVVIISKINLSQLEFRIIMKMSSYEEFLFCHQDLINYLRREVLEKMFHEILLNL